MAGLVPAIHRACVMRFRKWFVYIMTNKPFGTLYLGVTGFLARRAWQHKNGLGKFTSKYRLDRLVYYEGFDGPRAAIQREKTMKHWPRRWKLNVIGRMNPEWQDLYETIGPD
jgi:putative endonuclease